MNSPDDDLVRLAISGHRPAFDLLVGRTSRCVWSHLILKTRDRGLAEDLTQETYLRAWRSIGSVKDPGAFVGWLLSIADNVRLDEIKHRTRRKRGTPVVLDDPATLVSPDESPDDLAQANELTSRTLDALGELPDQYQQALSLRYLGGADYEQMSRSLSLTNGSLRGILHRGLQMLRDKLAETT